MTNQPDNKYDIFQRHLRLKQNNVQLEDEIEYVEKNINNSEKVSVEYPPNPDKYASYKYIWHSEPGACEDCQALNGKIFTKLEDIPRRPHPNCKCYVEARPITNMNSLVKNNHSDENPTTTIANKLIYQNPLVIIIYFYKIYYKIITEEDKQFLKSYEDSLSEVDKARFRTTLFFLKNITGSKKNFTGEPITIKDIADDFLVMGSTREIDRNIARLWIKATPEAYSFFLIGINENNYNEKYVQKNGILLKSIDELKNLELKQKIKTRLKKEEEMLDCKVFVLHQNSSLAMKIIKSNALKNFIKENKTELISKRKLENSDKDITFKSDDSDLYATFHGAKVVDMKLDRFNNLKFRIEDLYDFNPNRPSVKGRVGRKLQEQGELEPFYIIQPISIPHSIWTTFE